jgi:hypothetical protein
VTQQQMLPAVKELRDTINNYIADLNSSAVDVARLAVGFLFCNLLGGKDQAVLRRLEQLAACLVAYTRRYYDGKDGIHFIRLILNNTPVGGYSKRLNLAEFALFEKTEADINTIAMLNSCLCQVDPNPHVLGPESKVEQLPGIGS